MPLDIINFATKLLSKCIPVKVQYFKMQEWNSIVFRRRFRFFFYDKSSSFKMYKTISKTM